VTPHTSFIIGSITKAFTALAVMQLVEAGQVELDTPVQQYMPWFRVADPQASAHITVRQLLNQSSGLPMIRETQLWTEQDEGALERTVRFLETAQLDFWPGQSFGYSNTIAPMTYRQRYQRSTGRDPLRCPYGQHEMGVWRIWHPT
jgi:CubicO group peptidase (beta-lactamase class C family)